MLPTAHAQSIQALAKEDMRLDAVIEKSLRLINR